MIVSSRPVPVDGLFTIHDGERWFCFGEYEGSSTPISKAYEIGELVRETSRVSLHASRTVISGSDFAKNFTVSFPELFVFDDDDSVARGRVDEYSAFLYRGLELGRREYWTLSRTIDGKTYSTTGRVKSVDVDSKHGHAGAFYLSVEFESNIPHWLQENSSSGVIVSPTVTGFVRGLVTPLVLPYVATTLESRTEQLSVSEHGTIYPTFTITGPAIDARITIEHEGNIQKLYFKNVELAAGVTMTITTSPGNVSARTNTGINHTNNVDYSFSKVGDMRLFTGTNDISYEASGIIEGTSKLETTYTIAKMGVS